MRKCPLPQYFQMARYKNDPSKKALVLPGNDSAVFPKKVKMERALITAQGNLLLMGLCLHFAIK